MTKNIKGAGRKRKLTPLEEADIHSLYKQGQPLYEIVSIYKVSERTIHRIVKRQENITP